MKPVSEMNMKETIAAGNAALDYFEECLQQRQRLEEEMKTHEHPAHDENLLASYLDNEDAPSLAHLFGDDVYNDPDYDCMVEAVLAETLNRKV